MSSAALRPTRMNVAAFVGADVVATAPNVNAFSLAVNFVPRFEKSLLLISADANYTVGLGSGQHISATRFFVDGVQQSQVNQRYHGPISHTTPLMSPFGFPFYGHFYSTTLTQKVLLFSFLSIAGAATAALVGLDRIIVVREIEVLT